MGKSNANKLIHYVDVLAPTGDETQVGNTRGDIQLSYTHSFYAYARIEPLQGREQMVAQQMRADLTHKITMHVDARLTHRSVISWNNRTFFVGPPTQEEEYNFFYTFFAGEVRG